MHNMVPAQAEKCSKRAAQFKEFAVDVVAHIEQYTVPQYGDAPNDQIEEWSVETCVSQVKKYLNRFGRNQRAGQQELDFLKAAHILQVAHDKYLAEQKFNTEGNEAQREDK